MTLKLILVLLLLFTISFIAFSQQKLERQVPLSVGLYGGINLNMHSPSFSYPLTDRLILFDKNTTSIGSALGFIGLFPINNIFVISGKIGYNGLGGTLKKSDSMDFELDASINYIEISPELQIHNMLPIKDIYLLAGMETGIPLSPKYSLNGLPDTSAKIENENINGSSFRMAAVIGLGYFWEISKGVNLTPELTFRLPFTKISSDSKFDSWETPQLRFNLSLTFALETTSDPIPEDVSDLNVSFKEVRYYDNEGNYYPLERVKVEDVRYTEQFPLVPYIFCEENNEAPSTKMQKFHGKSEAGEFTISSLQADAFKINESALDIVGKRMEDNPNSELTLIGTNDNITETGKVDLSLKRAEYAKKYLTDNFKIIPERINVRATGLPEKPSSSKDPDGIAENRRIELVSSNPKILEPLTIQKENQTMADPNLIEFVPEVTSTDSILEWKLSLSQKGEELRSFVGDGEPGFIAWVIVPNELVKSELPIEYTLWAKNSKGLEKTAAGTVPVDYFSYTRKKTEELPDQSIAKFSLMLFDFDSDKISEKDLETINSEILPLIKFNSTVKIYGYTDRIGEEKYNKELAQRRASSIKIFLESKVKSAKYEVFALGENEQIFDNNLPLGRQLSRTVQIYVITPK